LVNTVISLFSAPMIGARSLGLSLTFSGVPVGSATTQTSALAIPVKRKRLREREQCAGCSFAVFL
jgi:hypothetical protein